MFRHHFISHTDSSPSPEGDYWVLNHLQSDHLQGLARYRSNMPLKLATVCNRYDSLFVLWNRHLFTFLLCVIPLVTWLHHHDSILFLSFFFVFFVTATFALTKQVTKPHQTTPQKASFAVRNKHFSMYHYFWHTDQVLRFSQELWNPMQVVNRLSGPFMSGSFPCLVMCFAQECNTGNSVSLWSKRLTTKLWDTSCVYLVI